MNFKSAAFETKLHTCSD